MAIYYGLDIINKDFIKAVINTVIEDDLEHEAFKCTIITSVRVEFKICPRVGELIVYPKHKLLHESLKNWLSQNIILEVVQVMHHPESLDQLYIKPDNEFDITLKVKAILKTRYEEN
ncbi:hypothetical protein NIES2101_37415 [Calothrix sp. HK-06]|nr:hypothetical protein NIES2101_37415 [Calothrix sp. HK-06]